MARRPLQTCPTRSLGSPIDDSPEYVGGYVDGDRIKLLYRQPDGQLRMRQHAAQYVSYHKFNLDDPKQESALRSVRSSRKIRRVLEEGSWIRVDWGDYGLRENGVRWLEMQGVGNWEADVSPIKRHFADTKDRTSPSPKIAFFDIETDSRVKFSEKERMRVLCWTVVANSPSVSADGSPIVPGQIWTGMLEEDTDEAEAYLLSCLWNAFKPFDVYGGWYADGFDNPVIEARSKLHRLGIDFRRWRKIDNLEIFRDMNAHVASSGDEKQSMSLNSICQSLLGEGKTDFDASKTWDYWEAGGEKRELLRVYNQQDTELLYKLEQKTQYVALFSTICAASNLFVETRSLGVHQQTDGALLRLGMERGYHWPTKPADKSFHEKVKGAYVMPAPERAGILKNIHVLDFSGMYPSIMITWNMSPETIRWVADDRPVAVCPLTKTNFYQDNEGILTIALQNDRAMRSEWTKRKASLPPNTPEWLAAERWAMGYKVMANSKYGVSLLSVGRYYQPRIGEGTTQNGQWLIKKTMEEAKRVDIIPLYGDTDSSMAACDSEERVTEFTNWCNRELYPRLVSECGCKQNYINIAYEKAYERIVFVGTKKYVARLLHYKGKRATEDSKPEIKGMEFKRGDALLVARRLQGEAIDLLIRDRCEDPSKFEPIIRRYMDHVLNDSLELEEIVLSKSLNKPIDSYVAETPPAHVRVAKILRDRGEDVSVGTKIFYLLVDMPKNGLAEVLPAKDWTGEIDRCGLWEKRVWPPTQRLLDAAFPNHDWKRFDKVRKEEKKRPKKQVSEQQVVLFAQDVGKVLRVTAEESRGFNEQGIKAARTILDMAKDGGARVELTLRLKGGDVMLELDRKVEVESKLLRRLRALLGEGAVVW